MREGERDGNRQRERQKKRAPRLHASTFILFPNCGHSMTSALQLPLPWLSKHEGHSLALQAKINPSPLSCSSQDILSQQQEVTKTPPTSNSCFHWPLSSIQMYFMYMKHAFIEIWSTHVRKSVILLYLLPITLLLLLLSPLTFLSHNHPNFIVLCICVFKSGLHI